MNQVTLMGRLTKDPEIRTVQDQTAVCRFILAVDRRFQKPGTDRQADFIPCVAWRKTAELISQYFRKGQRILVSGSLQSRSWDGPDGKKQFGMDVTVESFDFIESRSGSPEPTLSEPAQPTRTAPVAPPMADDSYFDPGDENTALPFDL